MNLRENNNDSVVLSIADQLPNSIRTLLRAKILVTLYYFQPTSSLEIVNNGFRKSTVGKVLRETNREGLTFERYRLHRLTDQGTRVVNLLMQDFLVRQWISTFQQYHFALHENISRPKVKRCTENDYI